MSFVSRCAAIEYAFELMKHNNGSDDIIADAEAFHDFLVADEPDEDEYVEDESGDCECEVCDCDTPARSVTFITVEGDYFEGDVLEDDE